MDYMKSRQDRSAIRVVKMTDLVKRSSGRISTENRRKTTVSARTMAELAIEGKVTAKQVFSAIKNGTIKAPMFKKVFWEEMGLGFFNRAKGQLVRQLAPILL